MRETRVLDCVAITREGLDCHSYRLDLYGPGVSMSVNVNTRSQAFDLGKRLLGAEVTIETRRTKKAVQTKVD